MNLTGPARAYRADIDGLRAIAVLSVIGYHAFPRTVAGGFTGVDIFFVISGFLISGLIYADLKRTRFTFTRFYARRFRRIFPALIVVLAACLCYGWFELAPDEYRELGKQAAGGAAFVSNLLLWLQSGYFDQQASAKPLLHLWSLGVEEQFYIAWPILIYMVYGRPRRLLLTLGVIIVASFVTCIATTMSDRSAAFFLPMSRFWELLAGALIAYWFAGKTVGETAENTQGRAFGQSLSWLGLFLLAAGLLTIGPDAAFPGWWALLPVLGTVCLLAAPNAWLNRKVLSAPLLVYVGLISYPLYLWHWVILTFARIGNDGQEIPRSWRVAAIGASFLLAWLTYQLVEKPIRFVANRDAIPRTLVALMAACAGAAALIAVTDGAVFRYPPEVQPLAAFNYGRERELHERAYRAGECFLSAKQTFVDLKPDCVDKMSKAAAPLVVLWGDSHAASLYPGLRASQRVNQFRLAQFTASGCPPIINLPTEHRKNCKSFNQSVIEALPSMAPDVVIIEGHWALYGGINGLPQFDPAALRETVEKIHAIGVRRIIVMGSLPTWKIYQPRASFEIWRRHHELPERSSEFLDASPLAADRMVRAAITGTSAVFVSPIEQLCDSRGCLISADPRRPIPMAWDNDHLSVAGSSLLVTRALTYTLREPGPPT